MYVCKICDNCESNTTYDVKEMMIGFNDSFKYMECHKCGCVQLIDIPKDLSRYYPDDYYSFEQDNSSWLKNMLFDMITKASISYYTHDNSSVIGNLLSALFPEILPPIKPSANVFNSKILDIGCGNGRMLKRLASVGFKNLYGVDPFIKCDLLYSNPKQGNIKIFKREIYEFDDGGDSTLLC